MRDPRKTAYPMLWRDLDEKTGKVTMRLHEWGGKRHWPARLSRETGYPALEGSTDRFVRVSDWDEYSDSALFVHADQRYAVVMGFLGWGWERVTHRFWVIADALHMIDWDEPERWRDVRDLRLPRLRTRREF